VAKLGRRGLRAEKKDPLKELDVEKREGARGIWGEGAERGRVGEPRAVAWWKLDGG
jgi:hypothetical protein